MDYARQIRPLLFWRTKLKHLSGTTIALIIVGVLSRAITVITQIVIAQKFGASIHSDAYFATETIPELFIDLLITGFSMAFIPLIMHYRFSENELSAQEFISTFLIGTTLFSLVFAGVIFSFSPQLVTLIAPGFSGETREITIQLVRILALSLLCLGLNAGLRGLLHSSKELLVPDLSRLGQNIVLCLFALFLAGQFGVVILAWGIVVGTLVQMLMQLHTAVHQGLLQIHWTFNGTKAKVIVKNILPLLVVLSWAGVTFMLDRMAASQLAAGSVTTLTYASRIILLPIGIFVLPLRTAIYPNLSTLFAQGLNTELANNVMMGLRVLLLIVIPACILLTVLRVPITRILFEHGEFDAAATLATSHALVFYALGVPAIAYIFYLNGVFMSLNTLYILIVFNLLSWGINLRLNQVLSQEMGFAGIALATAVSATITVICMLIYLKRFCLPQIDMRGLLILFSKIAIAALTMTTCLLLCKNIMDNVMPLNSFTGQLIYIASLCTIGLILYVLFMYSLQVREFKQLGAKIRRKTA